MPRGRARDARSRTAIVRWVALAGLALAGCALAMTGVGPARATSPQHEYMLQLAAACDHGVNAATEEWAATRRELTSDPAAWRDWTATYLSAERALRVCGDQHSKLYRPASLRQLHARYERQRAEQSYPVPEVRVLANGIGVVAVPGFTTMMDDVLARYEQQGREALRRAQSSGDVTRGWIVDLRGNTGGQLWSMLRVVAPLLPPGPIERHVYPSGRVDVLTKTETGVRLDGQPFALFDQPAGCTDLAVAVLIDERTASAGEMTAMALLANPAARSFGQPTAGYTTWVEHYWLPDGGTVRIPTGYATYANRPLVTGPLAPDVPVAADRAEQAAIGWLSALPVWSSPHGP